MINAAEPKIEKGKNKKVLTMHRVYSIILLIFSIVIFSCKPKISEHKFIQEINLGNALNNSDSSLGLNFEIFEEITYLQLENRANTVISGYPRFFCTENYILSNARRTSL